MQRQSDGPVKLSAAMERVLCNIVTGRGATYGLSTRAQFGGLRGTLTALFRFGLITEPRGSQATAEGRQMAAVIMARQGKESGL